MRASQLLPHIRRNVHAGAPTILIGCPAAEPASAALAPSRGRSGLRWACDHPDAVSGLVIGNTGFFPDYEWSEIARMMRTPIQGEALMNSVSRDALATLLEAVSSGIDERAIDEYWKPFFTPEGRRGMLKLYRSFDLDSSSPTREDSQDSRFPR